MAVKKQPIIVAAQLYSLRDYLKDAKELPKTFAKVKKIGYDYAQISGVSAQISAADLRKIMIDAGVEPIGAHVSVPVWQNNFKQAVSDCHAWGVQYAALPWLNWGEHKNDTMADWKKLIRSFEALAKKAAKEGINLQYHNHDFEFNQFGIKNGKGGKTILEMMYESTEVLQAELDFGWVVRGGNDPYLWAEKVAGRMDQTHFKDWGLIDGEWTFRALGEGRINWPGIAKACIRGGTRTFIVEQDTCKATNDPFKSLKISREYLKTFLG